MVGDQSNIMFSIFNTGKSVLYNVQVKFEGDTISGGEAFVGKIDVGATGNVDTMITAEAATMDDGTVKAVVYYEDDAGNVYTQEKEFTLFVNESFEMTDDMIYDEEQMQEGGSKKGIIITIIIVVVLLAGGIVLFLVLKKKKAKKERLDFEEYMFEEEDDNITDDIE